MAMIIIVLNCVSGNLPNVTCKEWMRLLSTVFTASGGYSTRLGSKIQTIILSVLINHIWVSKKTSGKMSSLSCLQAEIYSFLESTWNAWFCCGQIDPYKLSIGCCWYKKGSSNQTLYHKTTNIAWECINIQYTQIKK